MRLSRRTLIAYLGTFLVLGGMTLESRRYASVGDAEPFHARVRKAVEEYPRRIGAWTGSDGEIPAAATDLLQPNAILTRRFQNIDDDQVATVVVIQCADSRDMAGHYPPICWPNSGWTLRAEAGREDAGRTLELWGREVPYAEYVFEMAKGVSSQRVVIANFFVLPEGRIVVGMDEVREASGDYRYRPFGAGQLQVVFYDASLPREQREAVMKELLEPLGPAAEAMLERPSGTEDAS